MIQCIFSGGCASLSICDNAGTCQQTRSHDSEADEIADRVLAAAWEPNSGLPEPLRAAIIAHSEEAKEIIQRCAKAVLE